MVELERELDEIGRDPEKKSIEDLAEIRINPLEPDRFFLLGSQLADTEKAEMSSPRL